MKSFMKLIRLGGVMLLLFAGIWLLSGASGPAPESLERQQAIQAFAPVDVGDRDSFSEVVETTVSSPTVVNLADIPSGVYDPDNQYDRWQRGEIDLQEEFSRLPEPQMALLQAEAQKLPRSTNIQIANAGPSLQAPTSGVSFDSIDFTECCGGGGNVPPDPELAVGPNHIIAVVNVAFEIYDKSGNSLSGPTTFASFMASDPDCTGVFDPNALYDERSDRFILGIDADGTDYCIAVSQTGNPTGSWNIYSFSTGSSSLFFDYPHAGVGNDAIYMGANIFSNSSGSFLDSRVYAFNKQAMYNGTTAAMVTRNLGSNDDTPQPLNLHGWNQGTWPTSGPHYIITETGYNGANHTIYSWNDPFGANSFSTVGVVNLNSATGVTAGNTVSFPQSGGGSLQGNDWRPQDFEYRNGFAWTTMTIGCNPGGGTVNCVRWAQINPATATVVNAGVYSSSGQYRQFPDLAVNHCDDMAVGYTKSSSSMFPGIYVTGRLSTDPAGTLQSEVLQKSGEIAYTSFETSAPRRWGDYTEMTIDPNGLTFWYLGEYSKNTGTTQGRWGTHIGSYSFGSCSVGGPTPTPVPTATNTPAPTNTPTPTPPGPTPTNTPVPPTPTPPPGGGTIFFDNFETNLGWTTNPNGTDTATTGQWERANPQDTNSSGPKQLGTTVSGSNDLVTGALAGSSVGSFDIDNGVTSIRSPNISLPSGSAITLSFSYYLAHLNNSSSADFLRVTAVGSSSQVVFEELGAANDDDAVWDTASVSLNAFAGQTIYLLIEAADAAGGSLVEAAIDDVEITAGSAPSCTTYTSTNVPIALPNGTTTITSQLTVPSGATIADLNVDVNMAHVWVGDLSMVLTHQSTGTAVTIIDRPGVPASTYGCSGDNILATLDDEASGSVENQCAGGTPTINGTFSPNSALSAFDGQNSSGTWQLSVTDHFTSSDAGTLNGWSITVCSP